MSQNQSIQLQLSNSDPIAFTRYLYDKNEVLHSLLFALLDYNRDEALFWGYEIYFSGFEMELTQWLRWVYCTFYYDVDNWFHEFMEINITRLSTLPDQEERDCLFGTIIANLAHRKYDIQRFAQKCMNLSFEATSPPKYNHPVYIQFRPRDLEKYKTVVGIRARKYLSEVSRFPIRKSASLFLRKYVLASNERVDADTTDAYLNHWLYYTLKTPIWQKRISIYGHLQIDDYAKTVTILDDIECETFYAEFGYEPDEQSEIIHMIHGIDAHKKQIFEPICPHEFIALYGQDRIIKYS